MSDKDKEIFKKFEEIISDFLDSMADEFDENLPPFSDKELEESDQKYNEIITFLMKETQRRRER